MHNVILIGHCLTIARRINGYSLIGERGGEKSWDRERFREKDGQKFTIIKIIYSDKCEQYILIYFQTSKDDRTHKYMYMKKTLNYTMYMIVYQVNNTNLIPPLINQ